MTMKVVPGLSSVDNRAFICRVWSVGFMLPSSWYFNNSKALVQRALVYLDTSSEQRAQGVVELGLGVGNAAYAELALKLPKPGVWVVWPEVVDLECHFGDGVVV
jgi:hypothetical protein